MRVIGGTFGGRRIRAVDGHVTRPTSDRVREALFSRVDARYGLAGATVLDLFAGTGALAIEAISRGAARAVCIEVEKRAIDTLKGNLREFELTTRVRVFGDDYRRMLARLGGEKPPRGSDVARGSDARRRFDGVFIDPPYGRGLATDALEGVAGFGLVKPGGWVTVEVGRREDMPAAVVGPYGILERVREDVYGDTKLCLYEAGSEVTPSKSAGDEPAAEAER